MQWLFMNVCDANFLGKYKVLDFPPRVSHPVFHAPILCRAGSVILNGSICVLDRHLTSECVKAFTHDRFWFLKPIITYCVAIQKLVLDNFL